MCPCGWPGPLRLRRTHRPGADLRSRPGPRPGQIRLQARERVPYLHYYYTDQWFTRRGLTALGHIAANHSVWDLEIENLSSESLTLVYADFRVKQTYGEDRREIPRALYSLQEAFDVSSASWTMWTRPRGTVTGPFIPGFMSLSGICALWGPIRSFPEIRRSRKNVRISPSRTAARSSHPFYILPLSITST